LTIDFLGDVVIELVYENDFITSRPLRENLKMSREHVMKTRGS